MNTLLLRRTLLCVLCALVTSCGGPDTGLGFGANSDGELSGPNGALGQALSPLIVLDLTDGSVSIFQELPDLVANSAYRTSKMVFKRITGLGSSDYYLAVFECTQGQWKAIAEGQKPWDNIDASIVDPAVYGIDDSFPAYNLSHNLILSVLNGFNLTSAAQLHLPTLSQWQHACAAGTTTDWSWEGQITAPDTALSTVDDYAVVFESQLPGARGPELVASHLPNAYGLYDMHGNIWEWSGTGSNVMGGSWHDTIQQARTLNKAGVNNPELDTSTSHALIGCRLVLVP